MRSERQNSDYFIELFNHDKLVSYGKLSMPHSSGDNRVCSDMLENLVT